MKAMVTCNRDETITLWLGAIPYKRYDIDKWSALEEDGKRIRRQDLPEGINPQWSDDEPIEIKLKLERI